MSEDQELRELQDPSTWDTEKGEMRPGVRTPRAIVSVAFSSPELEAVASYARQHGMKTSEFIRTATLDRVHQPHTAIVYGVGIAVSGMSYRPTPAAQTSNPSTLRPAKDPLTAVG